MVLLTCVPICIMTDGVVQHKHAIEKEAVHEYWEKRGGAPDHH